MSQDRYESGAKEIEEAVKGVRDLRETEKGREAGELLNHNYKYTSLVVTNAYLNRLL